MATGYMHTLRLYLKDRLIIAAAAAVLFGQAALWWLALWRLPSGDEHIFLHYTSMFGVDLVGEKRILFLLPLGALIVALGNFSGGLLLYNRERFLARLLAVMAVMVQLWVFAAVWFIAGLNA